MSPNLVANFALLIAMTVTYRLVRARRPRGKDSSGGKGWARLAEGALFGVFCVAVMSVPYEVAEGVVFDTRSVLLAVCGLFCGPVAAAVAALIAVAFRLSLGGAGTSVGCLVIGAAAATGVVAHYIRRARPELMRPLPLLLFGVVVHAIMLLALLGLPLELRSAALAAITIPVVTIYPLASLLVCLLLLGAERERETVARLAESEGLLRRAFETASAGIVVCDSEQRIVRANPRFCRIMQLDAHELVGRDVLALIASRGEPDDPRCFADVANERTICCTLPTGDVRWLAVTASRVEDGDGASGTYVCVVEDVSRERRDGLEIARLGAAVSQISEAVVVTTRHGVIEFVNDAFERITGWDAASAIGQTPRILRHEKTPRATHEALWEAIFKGVAWRGRMTNRTRDGREYVAELSISPVLDDAGNIVQFVGVQRDVSEHDDLQRRLQQSEKMEAIGRLAGGVAHDFNNLLTVIGGYCELALRDEEDRSPRRSQLEEIRKAADRAADLTRQLLTFSRDRVAEVRPVDLGEVLSDVLKMLGRLVGEDVHLEVSVESSLPLVAADVGRIEQVLMNLVVNARDAMPRGGDLFISVREAADEGRVVLEVTDTGEGMTSDVAARVFDPFFTTKAAGTGLGLSTVYAIVTGLEGDVSVDSTPGMGTAFRVSLPTCNPAPEAGGRPTAAIPGVSANGLTVLVAEDDPGVRALVVAVLETAGYSVLSAPDARVATDVAAKHDAAIDLLLTDIVMPDRDGRELAQWMRQSRPDLRVLFMSGYTYDVVSRYGLGPDERIIQKPLTRSALLRAVEDALVAPARALATSRLAS